jgi:hypothetical protein
VQQAPLVQTVLWVQPVLPVLQALAAWLVRLVRRVALAPLALAGKQVLRELPVPLVLLVRQEPELRELRVPQVRLVRRVALAPLALAGKQVLLGLLGRQVSLEPPAPQEALGLLAQLAHLFFAAYTHQELRTK